MAAKPTYTNLLAEEARKLGANAVIEVGGGRRPTLLSWAAASLYGTAIKIENMEAPKALKGGTPTH